MTLGGGEQVEFHRRVVNTIKSPQDRDLMAQPMTPTVALLI
jgi:hypothetical protein